MKTGIVAKNYFPALRQVGWVVLKCNKLFINSVISRLKVLRCIIPIKQISNTTHKKILSMVSHVWYLKISFFLLGDHIRGSEKLDFIHMGDLSYLQWLVLKNSQNERSFNLIFIAELNSCNFKICFLFFLSKKTYLLGIQTQIIKKYFCKATIMR